MDESVPRPVGVQKSSGAAFLQLSHKLFYIPCIKIAPLKTPHSTPTQIFARIVLHLSQMYMSNIPHSGKVGRKERENGVCVAGGGGEGVE